MATVVTKQKLSGSTNGKGIKVAATATAGTLIHTAGAGETNWDEVWLWCVNSSASAIKLTIEWGEATAPDGNIEKTIPPEDGLYCIIPGLVIQNGLEIRAFAGTTNLLVIHGFVNRMTVS
jgi:hypothetical protein